MPAVSPVTALAARQQPGGAGTAPVNSALTLSRFLNRTRYSDLPPQAVEHAKMIVASTLASAAPGSLIGSARIVRDLAKDHGGKPEATIWFDGARLPGREVARVNATLSNAAARTTATSQRRARTARPARPAWPSPSRPGRPVRTCSAHVVGYEAAGRIGDADAAAAAVSRLADRRIRRGRRCSEAAQADRRADGARARHRGHDDGRPRHRHG